MIRIFTQHKFFLFAYLLFVPLSCLSSVRFALSFQPVIDATLQRSSFFSVAFSCAFWGIADLLLLLLVRRLRFALLARTKASFKQQLCSSILSAPYQMFENKDCLSLLNNDTQTICDCAFSPLCSQSTRSSGALSFPWPRSRCSTPPSPPPCWASGWSRCWRRTGWAGGWTRCRRPARR